jgi:hypothetical protein
MTINRPLQRKLFMQQGGEPSLEMMQPQQQMMMQPQQQMMMQPQQQMMVQPTPEESTQALFQQGEEIGQGILSQIDEAQDYEQLMNAIRGDEMPVEGRREELSGLVGKQDSQDTPESVLTLVQPTMALIETQGGIDGLMQQVSGDVPVEGDMAQGVGSMLMAGQPTEPVQMAKGGVVRKMALGSPNLPTMLEQSYKQILPIYEKALEGAITPDTGRRSAMLAGLKLTQGSGKPGASFATDAAQSLEAGLLLKAKEDAENRKILASAPLSALQASQGLLSSSIKASADQAGLRSDQLSPIPLQYMTQENAVEFLKNNGISTNDPAYPSILNAMSTDDSSIVGQPVIQAGNTVSINRTQKGSIKDFQLGLDAKGLPGDVFKKSSDALSTESAKASQLSERSEQIKINLTGLLDGNVKTGYEAIFSTYAPYVAKILPNFLTSDYIKKLVEVENPGRQQLESLINALIPAFRAKGSGPMSDKDADMYRSSIASITNEAEANFLSLHYLLHGIETSKIGVSYGEQNLQNAKTIKQMQEAQRLGKERAFGENLAYKRYTGIGSNVTQDEKGRPNYGSFSSKQLSDKGELNDAVRGFKEFYDNSPNQDVIEIPKFIKDLAKDPNGMTVLNTMFGKTIAEVLTTRTLIIKGFQQYPTVE